MAPRGRPKKRDTRMDAAIDALSQMGFAEAVIKKTVNSLLKTYDNQWLFIEDNAYKVLIEAILEDQENNSKMITDYGNEPAEPDTDNFLMGAAEGTNDNDVAGPLSAVSAHEAQEETPRRVIQPRVSKRTASQNGIPTKRTPDVPRTDMMMNRVPVPIARTKANHIPDSNNAVPLATDLAIAPLPDSMDGGGRGKSLVVVDRQVTDPRPSGQRRPSYGWISDSDEEDNVIFLVTAKTEGSKMPPNKGFLGMKSRWDN